jgi:chemotaxis protein histidine kinase CheA
MPAALPDEIVSRFRGMATERLGRIEAGWLALVEGVASESLAAEIHRELHTLKGDSHVVGFVEMNELCHRLEDLYALAEGHNFRVAEPIDLMMTMGLRFVGMLLLRQPGDSIAGIDLPGFVEQLQSVMSDARRAAETAPPPPPGRSSRTVAAVDRGDQLSDESRELLGRAAVGVYTEYANATGASRDGLLSAWNALRRFVESVTSVSLDARLRRHASTVADLAEKLGKEVWVGTSCDAVFVRPETASALDTALLHLLRNAVDHGIEAPADRRAVGKCVPAAIRLTAAEKNGSVEIVVTDDGGGVDWRGVRAVAIARGLCPEEKELSEGELSELLFRSGFSTAANVTDLSGRGVGLDAVAASVRQRGGSVELRSARGAGTTVTMRVPQAYPSVRAFRFGVPGTGVVLAVPAGWDVSFDARRGGNAMLSSAELLDVLRLRGASSERAAGVLRIARQGTEISLAASGPAEPCSAERICPAPADDVSEVVLIDGVESFLLRPDRLVPRRSLSSASSS